MNNEPILSGRMMMYGDSSYLASSVSVTLKELPDLQLLQKAVDSAVERCPWAAYGIREDGGMFYYSDHLSHTIKLAAWDEDEQPVLGGTEADGHLLGVYHQGKELRFCFFHGLTDGVGIITFMDATLNGYAALLHGETIAPADTPYPDAEADPLAIVDQAMQAAGVPWQPQSGGAGLSEEDFAAHGHLSDSGDGPCTYCVSADADSLMSFVKGQGIKPSAALVSLYATAVARVQPDVRRMRVAMPVNFRPVLGIPHTFRNCAMPPAMYDIVLSEGEGIEPFAARVNQTILQITSPVAELYTVKAFAGFMDKLPAMPYTQTEAMMTQASNVDRPPFTFNCSYAGRLVDTAYLDLIERIYLVTPAYGIAPVLETMAMPDRFCIAINQCGREDVYIRAFLDVLQECGIEAVLENTLSGARQYVALRETLGLR